MGPPKPCTAIRAPLQPPCSRTVTLPLAPIHIHPLSRASHAPTMNPALRTTTLLPANPKAWPRGILPTHQMCHVPKRNPQGLRVKNHIVSARPCAPTAKLHLQPPRTTPSPKLLRRKPCQMSANLTNALHTCTATVVLCCSYLGSHPPTCLCVPSPPGGR